MAQRGGRREVRRSNDRHQREKDRARASREERRATGSTEYETGLSACDLVFHAAYRAVEADEELAGVFGVPVGARLLERSYRTRYREEDAPFNIVRSYLPHDLVAANPDLLDETKEPWPGGTQSQLYTVGIEVDQVVEHVTARPATADEAAELGLPDGAPVMALRKVSTDVTGRVVDVSEVVLPGDRTELVFTTRLPRW
ncbi:UTRA domain-containing protein [Streptomyces silvisoli]|uniref:UTRA domain-containing protein n=1 Tax=Streptomyces silvisoli TaxID=3034235 RepID=A0ABT5ZQY9_9ACTN|nr:UTRA domain-containing protein [Streptomyces silvisoli]MDF3292231.1 UTRA domain-containing protein [Streptomyces silvisoli]